MADAFDIEAMTIADLMQRWPHVIPWLLRHRLACVGCSFRAFCHLEDLREAYPEAFQALADEIWVITGSIPQIPSDK